MIVNLERALKVGARLGGHFVMGHVDGTGRLASISRSGAGVVIRVEFPGPLERYLVFKGSIAVNGISLTIASLGDNWFEVAVVPHTLSNTNLSLIRPGDLVNLEVDILGKYIERFFQLGMKPDPSGRWTMEYLRGQGF